MPPHQRAERGEAHHAPDEHREPCVRHMDEHDLDRGALLVVVGHGEGLIESDQQQHRGRGRKPWQDARGQLQEPGRVGKIDQRHDAILLVVAAVAGNPHRGAQRELIPTSQSSPWRRLAAAANVPKTTPPSESAHRIKTGPQNEPRVTAAGGAPPPKTSPEIESATPTPASSSPPRCSVTANAAPIMPVKVSAGVPASSVSATAEVAAASRLSSSPSTGVATMSGSPAASQCASALAAQASSSGVRLITIRSSEPSS